MKKIQLIIILSTIFHLSFQIPKPLYKKVVKEIKTVFKTNQFSLHKIKISKEQKNNLKINTTTLFKIQNKNQLLGYAYVDKANSKVDKFDYLILLNTKLVILKTKILIYREDYGNEISSKRWLKQFIGLKTTDKIEYNINIDGISGATISAKSMTHAVAKALKKLQKLQKNNTL